MVTELRYQREAIRADYIRAAIGLAFAVAPLLFIPRIHWIFAVILAVLGVLFLAFGVRTWLRGRTLVLASPEGLTLQDHRRRHLPWEALEEVRLAYFSTRRDRSQGWMQLTLIGNGTKISLDSPLDHFHEIAEEAARHVRARSLPVSTATVLNYESLGIHGLKPADPLAGQAGQDEG
ncbi:MAG: hypothetical protein ACK4ZN_11020 [Oceanibaculum sp.]